MAAPILGTPGTLQAIGGKIFHGRWDTDREPLPTTVDLSYERIWPQVNLGKLKPKSGMRLSDTELAAQVGVSRAPLRQSLHRLAQDELVRFNAPRGIWVQTFAAEDVREMYDVRGALEVLAIRLAFHRLRPDDLLTVLDHLSTVRARLEERPVTLFLQHDFRLHNLVIRASRKGRLFRMLAALQRQVSLFQIQDTEYPSRMETELNDHERIGMAVLEGQQEQALEHLAIHIAHSKTRVLTDIFNEIDNE